MCVCVPKKMQGEMGVWGGGREGGGGMVPLKMVKNKTKTKQHKTVQSEE